MEIYGVSHSRSLYSIHKLVRVNRDFNTQNKVHISAQSCFIRPRTHGNVFLRFCSIVSSNGLVVLDSLENSKQYKNAGKRFRVYGASSYSILTIESFVYFSSVSLAQWFIKASFLAETWRPAWDRLIQYNLLSKVSDRFGFALRKCSHSFRSISGSFRSISHSIRLDRSQFDSFELSLFDSDRFWQA